jgi:phage-related protein (TIGR01555 family)
VSVNRTKRPKDAAAVIRDGIMRHIAGQERVATKRAAKVDTALPAAAAPVAEAAKPRGRMKISDDALLAMKRMRVTPSGARRAASPQEIETTFRPYQPLKGVIPEKDVKLAMDDALQATASFQVLAQWGGGWGGDGLNTAFAEGLGFLGYSYLAELTQRPEYRRMSERIATEMTREWIELQSTSSDSEVPGVQTGIEKDPENPPDGTAPGVPAEQDAGGSTPQEVRQSVEKVKQSAKTKKLKELEDELKRLKVKDAFYNAAEQDGWFGRSHIFLEIGGVMATDNDAEQATSIGNGNDIVSQSKVGPGGADVVTAKKTAKKPASGDVEKGKPLTALQNVEPMWAYPSAYESVDPRKPGFYNPSHWYVNGRNTHSTRLLTFVGRELPDILKPAYSFGGLALSQMAKPYVDNWLRTRQAVADLIESFSVSGVYTNMQGVLEDGGAEAIKRIELFNITRSNAGAYMLDKDTEEFFNVSTPLGTLDALQAQSQEQMSSVSGIPLIILLGITPTGLNASSEGEIRAFYDWIKAYQESFFRDHLQTVIEFVQLSLWGKVDPEITFVFKPLWSMTKKEEAEVQKIEAETDQIYIDAGVLHPEEPRKALAAAPGSRFSDINVEDVPEPPADPTGEDDPFGGGDDDGGGSDGGGDGKDPTQAEDGVFAFDTEWVEDDHPRADDGKFGSGGGSAPAKSEGSPHAATKGKFKQAGRGNLKEQGLKPRKRGAGNDLTQVAQVAWSHAMETGKSQTLAPSTGKNSWVFTKSGSSMPYGSPHVVVDPDGTVTMYQPDFSVTKEDEAKFNADREAKKTAPIKMKNLTKQGGKLGSNEGGVYTDDDDGETKFYVKKPATKAHVENEKTAARLYQLAGVNTLNYRDVEGGEHVATEWQELDKNNIRDFTPAEKKAAAADFAVHAWLSNWDAAGLGGDNQGILAGKPTTLDVGGSLRFRAQGGPKGAAFGDKVTELDTLRDKSMNPDAAGLFGSMSDADIKSSIERVTSIPDAKIREAVGGDDALADRLIARKNDMGKRFGVKVAQDEALSSDEAMMLAALESPVGLELGDVEMMMVALDQALELSIEEIAPDVFTVDPIALDEFNESKVKRDEGGKFSSTGGGGGGGAEHAVSKSDVDNALAALQDDPDFASGSAKPAFKTKKEHIAHLLTKGVTPKELMTEMGWPSVSMPAQAKSLGMKLEKKDGKYFGTKMSPEELKAAKEAEQDAITQKALAKHPIAETLPGSSAGQKHQDLSTMAGLPAPKLNEVPAPSAAKVDSSSYANWLGDLAGAIEEKHASKVMQVMEANPEFAKEWKSKASPKGLAALEAVVGKGALEPQPKAKQASPEELKKAKKSTALPMAIMSPKGGELIKAFNEKYQGKDNLTDEQLNQKVQDYKVLQVGVGKADADYATQQQVEQASIQKKQAEEQKKKMAAQAAKLAAEMNDPEVKAHYDVLKGIGVSLSEPEKKSFEKKIKDNDLKITPHQAAYIQAYVGSHYGPVNSQLRKGVVTMEQYKYGQALDEALDKMPVYKGLVERGVSLDSSQFAKYQNAVGKVIPEPGFQSAGVKSKLWGDHTMVIQSKTARDIRSFNPGEGGGEVVFKQNTPFLVTKVVGKKIYLQEV